MEMPCLTHSYRSDYYLEAYDSNITPDINKSNLVDEHVNDNDVVVGVAEDVDDENQDVDSCSSDDSMKHLNSLLFDAPNQTQLSLDWLKSQLVCQQINSSESHVMLNMNDGDQKWTFCLDPVDARLTIGLRQKWHSLFMRKLKNPGKQSPPQDEVGFLCLFLI